MQQTSRIVRIVLGLLVFAGLVDTRNAQAQRPDMLAGADTARMKMAPLRWLLGEWSGPATVTRGTQKFVMTQRETVVEAANGTVFMIRGRGSMKLPDNTERETFQAAGMLGYDIGSKRFSWVSSGGTGHMGMTEALVNGSGFVWMVPDGRGGRTRYTISQTPAGEWYEIGETTSDGTTWTKTFEMTLVKKP